MSGQTLVFVPVVLLMITVFFCITYNVAWYCQQRVALQEAADSAAIGAARVQGMMLESIAAGNDAIAWNVARIITTDIPELFDPATFESALEDIVQRIEWIEKIQNVQGTLGSTYFGGALVETAAYLNGTAAGADAAFALGPSRNNIIGIEVPDTCNATPQLLVESPAVWTAFLFTMPEPQIPNEPSSFPLEEKPVIVATSHPTGEIPLPIPLFGNKVSLLTATSASAPYFIPLGGDPMDREAMVGEKNFWRGWLCLMIPGPFWGARLDEVGPLSDKSLGIGGAVWASQKVVSYTIEKVLEFMKDTLQKRAIETLKNQVTNENEIEMETFVDGE
jgi:hypothetical protein